MPHPFTDGVSPSVLWRVYPSVVVVVVIVEVMLMVVEVVMVAASMN